MASSIPDSFHTKGRFFKTNAFLDGDTFATLLKMRKYAAADVAKIEQMRGGASFKEIWSFRVKHHKARDMVTVCNACDNYVRNMREVGKPESHVVRVRRILEQFCPDFGDGLLNSITRMGTGSGRFRLGRRRSAIARL